MSSKSKAESRRIVCERNAAVERNARFPLCICLKRRALFADFWSISTRRYLTFCNTHSTMQLSRSVSASFIQPASRWIADFQFSQPGDSVSLSPQSAYKYVIRCLATPITVLTPLASLFIRNWGRASHAKGVLYPSTIGRDAAIVALKRKAADVVIHR